MRTGPLLLLHYFSRLIILLLGLQASVLIFSFSVSILPYLRFYSHNSPLWLPPLHRPRHPISPSLFVPCCAFHSLSRASILCKCHLGFVSALWLRGGQVSRDRDIRWCLWRSI